MNISDCKNLSDLEIANAFLKIYSNLYESSSGNRNFFLNFFAFALQRAKTSYCENGIDLVVPYLLNEKRCLNFVEIGSGIPLDGSLTALLEAKYGWNGILYEDHSPNIPQLRDCRQAFVCEANKFISSEYCDIHKKHLDGPISFLSIRGFKTKDVLNAIDFNVEKIPVVYIYASLEELTDLTQFFCKFDYNPWLTEYFIVGDFAHAFFVHGDINETHFNSFNYLAAEKVKSCSIDSSASTKSFKNFVALKKNKNKLELLSCHFPKAGGASLLEGIKSCYTGKSLHLDYEHIPGVPSHNSIRPLCLGSEVRAVHGHFHIRSYSNLNPQFTIAFIRDPVKLLISFYEYIKINPSYAQVMGIKLVPLPEFILANSFAPYKLYFNNVEPADFDFIGLVDFFEDSLINLSKITGLKFPLFNINTGSKNLYHEDGNLINSLKDQLRSEYIIYDKFLKKAC